jgi:hypothetical protein
VPLLITTAFLACDPAKTRAFICHRQCGESMQHEPQTHTPGVTVSAVPGLQNTRMSQPG